MGSSIKIFFFTLLVGGVGFYARADYESQRWTVGQEPHRIGIVGVNNDETRIYWGDESWDGHHLILPVHPYTFLAMVNVPILVFGIAFILRGRYRRRCASAGRVTGLGLAGRMSSRTSSRRGVASLLLALWGLIFLAWAFGALVFGEFHALWGRSFKQSSRTLVTPETRPRFFWCSAGGAGLIGASALVGAIVVLRKGHT
jgi:hypothetical protein